MNHDLPPIPFKQAQLGGVVNMVPHDPPEKVDPALPEWNTIKLVQELAETKRSHAKLNDDFAAVCRANSELADKVIGWELDKNGAARSIAKEFIAIGRATYREEIALTPDLGKAYDEDEQILVGIVLEHLAKLTPPSPPPAVP